MILILEVEPQQMADRANKQSKAIQNRKIDDILASDAFLPPNKERDDLRVIAFRVLGTIFTLNPSHSSLGAFHAQIRRALPGKSGAECDELYNNALAVYGY